MAVVTEERAYILFLFILLMCEVIMSIPLVTDSLLMQGSSIVMLTAIGHFFCYLYGRSGFVRGAVGTANIMGAMGLFITVIPVISFIWHGVVAYMLGKHMVNMIKTEITDGKDVEDNKSD